MPTDYEEGGWRGDKNFEKYLHQPYFRHVATYNVAHCKTNLSELLLNFVKSALSGGLNQVFKGHILSLKCIESFLSVAQTYNHTLT